LGVRHIRGASCPTASPLWARVASPSAATRQALPTTFHRLIDHRNHLRSSAAWGRPIPMYSRSVPACWS
jgi:hypothetical protein